MRVAPLLLSGILLAGCAPLVPPSAAPTVGQPVSTEAQGQAPAPSTPDTPTSPSSDPGTAPTAPSSPTTGASGGSGGGNAEKPPVTGGLDMSQEAHSHDTWATSFALNRPRFGLAAGSVGGHLVVTSGDYRGSAEALVDGVWLMTPVAEGTYYPAAGTVAGDRLYTIDPLTLSVTNADGDKDAILILVESLDSEFQISREAGAIAYLHDRVVVAGGSLGDGTLAPVVAAADPTATQPVEGKKYPRAFFERCAPMPTLVAGAGFVTLDDRLVVMGGYTLNEGRPVAQTAVQVYDALEDAWTTDALPPLPAPRHSGAAAVLDGAVYFAGGLDDQDALCGEVWRWKPGEAAWTLVTTMPTPRRLFAMVAHEGKLWTLGGLDAERRPTTLVEVYRP